MMENPHNIGQSAHLLFVAKNLERVGDHATNIAEMVYYAATGEHMADRPGNPAEGSAMANKRLLLVEDDRALADLVAFHFERAGYEVTRTGDGEEALILVDEVKPDVILLDWMIEGISGIEVCRRLRRRATTANVPIMMLTARGEESDRIRGFETGADDYVTKPFSPRELVARVGAVLRRVRPGACRRAARLMPISRWTSPRIGFAAAGSTFRSARPNSACSSISSSIPAASSRASGCSTPCGRHDPDIDARTVDVHVRRLRQALNAGATAGPHPHRSVRRLFARQRGLSFNENGPPISGGPSGEFRFG